MQMPDAVYHLMRETPLLQCSLASNVIAKIPPKFFISFNNLTGTLTQNLFIIFFGGLQYVGFEPRELSGALPT
jgi:hypothetical protein